MSRNIPNRWTNYKPYGNKISDTRFVAFKVPLRSSVNEEVEETLRLDAEMLMEAIPDLGLIIDLTDTYRYYNPECFETKGVKYRKIKTPGHITPSNHLVRMFKNYVNEYLRDNEDNSKLIGVHCTHGVNRTGFFICNYMISEMTMSPDDAIKKFTDARGHSIERANYVRALMGLKSKISEDQTSEYYLPTKRTFDERFINYEQSSSYHNDGPSCIKQSKSDLINVIPLESYGGKNLEFISVAKQENDNELDNSHPYHLRNDDEKQRTRINDEGKGNSSDRFPMNDDHSNHDERRKYYRREHITTNWRDRYDDERSSYRNRRDRYDDQRSSNRHSNWRDRYDDQSSSNRYSNWRDRSDDQASRTRNDDSVRKYSWTRSESNTK